MRNKKLLNSEKKTLNDLKTIVESYEEIAAMRMRKVKKSVLQSRDFLSGLDDIYRRVIYTYQMYAQSKQPKKKTLPVTRQTNGKTVSVLVSSNTGLYGDIVKRTFDLFAKETVGNSNDLIILGRIGKQLYENFGGRRDYKYYEISDTGTDRDKMTPILNDILSYTNIIVYHGIFVSILSQQPVATFVTGKALNVGEEKKIQELKCIIEPSVEEVTAFFEKQILSSIFEQSLYESSLSKFASRMVSLDFANDNIAQSIKKVNFATLKLKHMRESFDQIERMSGMSLWS